MVMLSTRNFKMLGTYASALRIRAILPHNQKEPFGYIQFSTRPNRTRRLHRRTSSTMAAELVAVKVEDARNFMEECLKTSGSSAGPAAEQTAVMLEADRQGHFSHGMNRLAFYCNDILSKSCDPSQKPTILKESPATAWIDGKNALGATVGNFCMGLAIKKAKECGVGWVVAKNSNHYGIAGWYSMQALKQGMIGMSFTNTSPLMAPTRSKQAALGTNPISLAAPAENGDRFVLDMATTTAAVGKIEIQRQKGDPLPHGWAQDPNGHITTDSEVAFATGCLTPLGGIEELSGYKGYGLGAMVEILCGISSGSLYGTHIRHWSLMGDGNEANLGQCFIAMDPSNFAPGFETRMSDLLQILRGLDRTDADKEVLAPGDKEAAMTRKTEEAGIIGYHISQIKACEVLASNLKIDNIKYTKMNA